MKLSPKFLLLFFLVAGIGYWFLNKSSSGVVRNAPPPATGPIVALGDSLTFGLGAPAGQGYVDVLSREIGRPVVNRGVNGDTIANAELRLEKDVLAQRPAIVIVLLGGNDMLRKNNLDDAFARLEAMIRRMQDQGAMVVLVGIQGLLLSDLGSRYKELAGRTQALFVPDILDGIFGRPSRMSDSIHPNAAGYEIMGHRIARALKPYLK